MKFYSGLLAIALIAASIMPSPASFFSNPHQAVATVKHENPPPKPHRGQGRRELNG